MVDGSAARVLAVCAALFLAPGCAGRAGAAGASAPFVAGAHASWAVRAFGRPPDMVSVFKPFPGMDMDNVRLGHERAEDSVVGYAYAHCRQADGYFYGDVDRGALGDADDAGNGVEVYHGVPSGLDPGRPWKGKAPLMLSERFGDGVRVYRQRAPDKDQVRLFVLPGSAWIIARVPLADRVARVLASDGSEPPPLASIPGSWVEEVRRVDANKRRALENLGWQPELEDLDRLMAVGQVFYAAPRGKRMVIGLELAFTDAATASDAAAEAARDPRLHVRDFVGVDRFGTTVVIKTLESDRGR